MKAGLKCAYRPRGLSAAHLRWRFLPETPGVRDPSPGEAVPLHPEAAGFAGRYGRRAHLDAYAWDKAGRGRRTESTHGGTTRRGDTHVVDVAAGHGHGHGARQPHRGMCAPPRPLASRSGAVRTGVAHEQPVQVADGPRDGTGVSTLQDQQHVGRVTGEGPYGDRAPPFQGITDDTEVGQHRGRPGPRRPSAWDCTIACRNWPHEWLRARSTD